MDVNRHVNGNSSGETHCGEWQQEARIQPISFITLDADRELKLFIF